MASFTFGSFGDIITLTQIAYKVYDAIDSNGDLAKRLKVSKSDRETFLKACASVERAVKVGGPMSEDDAAAVKHVVTECNQFLAEFEKYLDKFTDPRQVVRFMRRVQSALFNKDESSHFQDRLRHHSMMLGLVLGPIQAKYTSLDLKAHITSSLDPWDQKPMQLQDALGRRYPVPLEVCSSFEVSRQLHLCMLGQNLMAYQGLLNFLQFAFKSNPSIYTAVKQQQFWMITPKGWDTQSWYIVQKEDWKSIARPGTRLGMFFYTERQQRNDGPSEILMAPENPNELSGCRGCRRRVEDRIPATADDVVDMTTSGSFVRIGGSLDEFIASLKFNDPMPSWALYNPDTKFQLL